MWHWIALSNEIDVSDHSTFDTNNFCSKAYSHTVTYEETDYVVQGNKTTNEID